MSHQNCILRRQDIEFIAFVCKNVLINSARPTPKSEAVSNRMRGIGTKRTAVEKRARSVLRLQKIKYKGNVKSLPGSPDLVIPAFNLAIFVNGCFWHGCPRCYTAPKHNRKWWNQKISNNRRRDRRVIRKLRNQGYSVLNLWEHDSDERMKILIRGAINRQLLKQ